MTPPDDFEFSRPVSPEAIGAQGRTLSIEADQGECARLAQRLGLNSLESLSAEIALTSQKKGRIIHLEGSFKADIQQTCVVTMEPVETRIEATFERLYDTAMKTPDDSAGDDKNAAAEIDSEGQDPPEPLVEGKIDIGEAIAEQLSLEINPFPRKPGIPFADYSTGTGAGKGKGEADKSVSNAGPFSGLAALKKKLKK